ncbi:hypothetical protein IQ235_11335 [Oscillatoriales cyanobacterium LEGE 11467]|uniref:Methyltransferase type 11 domain-containing protein n=2 Tax=Zarconia TaxID=2992130 RepID=A0A928VW16_9CYAN|nr:hypothetical protein [Zarconia navalis LEGE 11467]
MQASLKVRRQMYDWFIRQTGGVAGKTVLDFGATPDTSRADSNCFLRWLLEDGARVYATSPEEIASLERIFPGLKTITFPPEKSQCFDFVISSAVIEHVGSEDRQIEYVRDLLQLSDRILLTTPNRYHWLDFHTKLPLLHWLPKDRHRQILNLLGLKFWAKEENLNLLSKTDLVRILDRISTTHLPGKKLTLSWYQPKFLGKVSNFAILIQSVWV